MTFKYIVSHLLSNITNKQTKCLLYGCSFEIYKRAKKNFIVVVERKLKYPYIISKEIDKPVSKKFLHETF